jgi:hypothetical protein
MRVVLPLEFFLVFYEEFKVPHIIQHQTIVDMALECADTVGKKLQSPHLHFKRVSE